jgi:anti-sigma-K factor RskA
MNYNPVHDRLASEYVLGSLHGRARARFETLLRDEPVLQARVAFWERALMPMALALSSAPSAHVWNAIAARVAPRALARAPGWLERWFGVRTLAPLAAGLFLGVAATLLGPTLLDPSAADVAETQLPESYVGVLAGADGRAGLIVSSRRHGTVMDLKQVQPVAVNAGQTLFLWVIEADGKTQPIGAVPQGKFVQVPLAQTSEKLFAAHPPPPPPPRPAGGSSTAACAESCGACPHPKNRYSHVEAAASRTARDPNVGRRWGKQKPAPPAPPPLNRHRTSR